MTARKAKRKAVDNLYASLTPQELAKLLARLYREQDEKEMLRLRDSIPPGRADEYNYPVRVLNNMELIGVMGLRVSWLTMERNGALVLNEMRKRQTWDQARSHAFTASRLLPGYPVTESEHRALLELHRDELQPLDDFVQYIAENDWDSDDAGFNPTVRAWLAEERPDDIPEEDYWAQAEREVRALLDAAIERGELPTPQDTPNGPALPRGLLQGWLKGPAGETLTGYPPTWAIPTLEALSLSLTIDWDIRPDSEADTVRRQREHICETFATLLGLDDAQRARINPHPAATPEQRERELREWEAVWPHRPKPDVRERFLKVLELYVSNRLEMYAIINALDIIQREDFYGEDALPAHFRSVLDEARGADERFHEVWDLAQGHFGWGEALEETLPDIPEPDADELEQTSLQIVEMLRTFR